MRNLRIATTSAVVVVLCISARILAQSAPAAPAHNQVIMVHLKPDMVNEWINIQKNELIPAQKKGGLKTRTTYHTVIGNTNEYVTVTPIDKYAQLEAQTPQVKALGVEAAARITAKLQKCTDSRELFISNPQPDLSNTPAGTLPPIGVFIRHRVAPGRLDEYMNLVKAEYLPIYKKAGERFTVTRRGLGANNNDVTTVAYVNKLADLDAGPATTRALGQAGAAKLDAKAASMAPVIEQIVRQRVPELSF